MIWGFPRISPGHPIADGGGIDPNGGFDSTRGTHMNQTAERPNSTPAQGDRGLSPDWTSTAPTRSGDRAQRSAGAPLAQWLVDQRNAHVTPDAIATRLIGNGWDADNAARVALRSLRSADRQTLTYAALTVTAGVGALAVAGSAHLLLDGNPDPMALTIALTVALVAVPIAGIVAYFTRRSERRSRYVMWSASRRGWFGTLAFCTGAVGTFRLLDYLFSAIATLTGASDDPFSVAAASQVLIALGVSVPMFLWSFREWRRSNLVISALADDGDHSDQDTAAAAATASAEQSTPIR